MRCAIRSCKWRVETGFAGTKQKRFGMARSSVQHIDSRYPRSTATQARAHTPFCMGPAAHTPPLCRPDWRSQREMARSFAQKLFIRRTLTCLLYTSDAADDLLCVDLGG